VQLRALVEAAGDRGLPGELEEIRFDGGEVSDDDRDGLESSASARVHGLARDPENLGGQSELVHESEYRIGSETAA